MSESLEIKPAGWPAFGPEKEAWKKGNYYTAEELRLMEADLKSLTINRRPRKIHDANG